MNSYLRIVVSMFLLVLAVLAAFMLYEQTRVTLRSRATFGVISASNSLVVATPACVPADGVSRQRLYVYCNNSRGFGEPNVPVSVRPTLNTLALEVIPVQGITDFSGKGIIDITSSVPGSHQLVIQCDETEVADGFMSCFSR